MSDNPALGPDWYPSPWRAEDQRGNANLLGPAKVLEALRLVRLGETIPLGFPCTAQMPFSPGRSLTLTLQVGPEGRGGPVGEASQTVWNGDFLAVEIGQMGRIWMPWGTSGIGTGSLAVNARRCSTTATSSLTSGRPTVDAAWH